MEIYRSINDFSSGSHEILCPLQVHTTQQIKKNFWLGLHRLRQKKKKNCSTGPCAIITNTYCCKKSIARPEARIHQTISINIYSFFFFFFFVDLWSSPFFFYFMNFILCLMNVLISCCKFRGEVCFVYCLLAQHSLFINFSCLTSSLTVNDSRAKNYLWSFTPPS